MSPLIQRKTAEGSAFMEILHHMLCRGFYLSKLWRIKRLSSDSVILMFHDISNQDLFWSQMKFVKKEFNVVSLSRFIQTNDLRETSKANAVITFDDGYLSTFAIARPILEELDLVGTIFVAPGLLSDYGKKTNSRMMSCLQVKELSMSDVFEIGGHTYNHINLGAISTEQAELEISSGREALEELTGKQILTFAYPFGKKTLNYNDSTISLVEKSGFIGAVSTNRGKNRNIVSQKYELNRIGIDKKDTFESFVLKVHGLYPYRLVEKGIRLRSLVRGV